LKIAVMGAGGLGGYYGGMLAKAGNEVSFVARGEHLKAIQQRGLKVTSVHGEFSVQAKATSDPAEIGPADLVLFCVKSYDTEEAARAIIPIVETRGSVLTLQNGVDNNEKIGAIVGDGKVLAGAAFIASEVQSPGVIRQSGGPRNVVFGEVEGGITERGMRIYETMKSADIICELSDDIRKALWEKFVWICAMAGMTCLTRLPIGPIVATKETRTMFRQIMEEVTTVARAVGIGIEDGFVDQMMGLASRLEKGATTSMFHDLAAGRRLELQALHGTVVKLGERHGVPIPMNRAVFAALKPHEFGFSV
jgi:2-dehydropantoate 2-reductase